jgi:hypothetical protein
MGFEPFFRLNHVGIGRDYKSMVNLTEFESRPTFGDYGTELGSRGIYPRLLPTAHGNCKEGA